MSIFKNFWFRLLAALMATLLINLAVLFAILPTTTLGIMIKDVISLIVFAAIVFKVLKDD